MPNVLPFIPLGIIGIITWSLWGIRRLYGTNYRPFQGSYTATTSVVVPVYMEDPEVLRRAIKSYIANNVGEVILVVDSGDTRNIENIRKNFPFPKYPKVKLIITDEPGKRPALAWGIREATGETFLGKICVGGDDLRLTHLLLSSGYKTVYQSTAQARTVYSGRLSNFVRRKIRWSRNSYRGNLRAFWQGWIWRKSWILPVSMFHATITPYTLAIGALATAYLALTSPGTATTIFGIAFNLPLVWLVASIGGRSFKGISHLRRVPKDVSLAIVMTFVMLFLMVPVKIFSLATMNRQGWVGTRNSPKSIH